MEVNETEENDEISSPKQQKEQNKAFTLADAMLNKKQLQKARDDLKKVKQIMVELQNYVQNHQIIINQDMVSEKKLQISIELVEQQMRERQKKDLEKFIESVKHKFKKRIKLKDIEDKMIEKVGRQEFLKHIERIDQFVQIMHDKVEYQLPAFKFEYQREMKTKADVESVNQLLDKKVDKEFIDQLLERINKIEEMVAVSLSKAKKKQDSDEDDDDVEEKNLNTNAVETKAINMESDDDNQNNKKKKSEEAQRAMKEMIEKLQSQLGQSIDEIRSKQDDQKIQIRKILEQVDDLQKQQKEIRAAQSQSQNVGMSAEQKQMIGQMNEALQKHDSEIERLQRIDFRLNKELVQKPYQYIEKVKEALDKEQKEIINIIKLNNDKYIKKISQIDQKINNVLLDSEILLDQYRKKIGDIGKNLESIKKYKEEINLQFNNLQKQQENHSQVCDKNYNNYTQHLNRFQLKFAETTIDLKSANDGYQREIERIQQLFKELQKEFLQQLEIKRQQNESLLRAAGIDENELEKADRLAQLSSKKKMNDLLPKLQLTHIESNIQLTGRQDKILAILKGDKVSPQLTSAKKYYRSPSQMEMGNDLSHLGNLKNSNSKASFITAFNSPQKSVNDASKKENSNFHIRKNTLIPSLPSLFDSLSQQEQSNTVLMKKNELYSKILDKKK